MKRTILFVLPHLEMGGADRFNLDLVRSLHGSGGWEIVLLLTRASQNAWQSEFEGYVSRIYLLTDPVCPSTPREKIKQVLSSHRVSLLFLSHSVFGYSILPWLRWQYPELRIVDYVHMVDAGWREGGYARLSCNQSAYLDCTLTSSRSAELWMAGHGHREGKIEVVYTNIDTELWRKSDALIASARDRFGLSGAVFTILFAGRLADQKRPKLLKEIVEGLLGRNVSFKLVIVGDGPDKKWILDHVVRLYPEHVLYFGAVAPDGMREIMAGCDALILPSKHEGIALSLYEAMSMELIPVVTNVGGQQELVTPATGFLIDSHGDVVPCMLNALAKLAGQPALRARMGKTARAKVEHDHDFRLSAARISAIFEETVSSNFGERPAHSLMSDTKREKSFERAVAEMEEDNRRAALWKKQQERGKEFPRVISRIAGFGRSIPIAGKWIMRLESRYGEKIGAWLLRH